MNKTDFKEKVFMPIAQKHVAKVLDVNEAEIAPNIYEAMALIANKSHDVDMPKKYIALMLSRTHLHLTGEFLYVAKVFDERFQLSYDLSDECSYNAFWITENFKNFNNDLDEAASKNMIKHDRVFLDELIMQGVEYFNTCFVQIAKKLLEEGSGEIKLSEDVKRAFAKMTVVTGDYMFDFKCLTKSRFEKIKGKECEL